MDKGTFGGLIMESQQEKDMYKNDVAHVKSVYRLHLIYVVIICGIILICSLCVIPKCVSSSAFQNFSFASTIVSIVLAVVSIVYSLWSGQKSNNQYVGMAHIESKIDQQLKGFERIEETFSRKLNPLNSQLEQIKEDQTKTRQAMDKMSDRISSNVPTTSHEEKEKYNTEVSPAYAELTLYLFALANKKGKKITAKYADEITDKYWSGFMVAFSCSLSDKLNYRISKDGISIITFDTDYFGNDQEIRKRISEKYKTLEGTVNEIDNYFSDSSTNNC